MQFIDSHVHIWTEDKKTYRRQASYPIPGGINTNRIEVNPEHFPPETIISLAKPFGIDRICLVQMSFYGTDNGYILDAIKRYPQVFRGAGYVDSNMPNLENEMETLLTKGINGFRLVPEDRHVGSWLQTPGYDAMFSAAAETKQALSCLINSNAFNEIDRMSVRHPNTVIIIDHLGRIGANGTILQSDIDQLCALSRNENIYLKVSAFYALGNKKPPHLDLLPLIKQVYNSYGSDRLMWASDAPPALIGETYEDQISLIRDHIDFISERDKEKLMRTTAERIFFFK
jgi:predicted TIM-barrel fold metal-dependent hydrolase